MLPSSQVAILGESCLLEFVFCESIYFERITGELMTIKKLAAHRYAAYRENKSIITTKYFDAVTTLTATSLLESDGGLSRVGYGIWQKGEKTVFIAANYSDTE